MDDKQSKNKDIKPIEIKKDAVLENLKKEKNDELLAKVIKTMLNKDKLN